MQNGVYCCVIHETKYYVSILCTVITLLSNEINLFMRKCFFQIYTIVIFQFFEKRFYIMNVNFEIFIKTHVLYTSIMKPEAASGGVL